MWIVSRAGEVLPFTGLIPAQSLEQQEYNYHGPCSISINRSIRFLQRRSSSSSQNIDPPISASAFGRIKRSARRLPPTRSTVQLFIWKVGSNQVTDVRRNYSAGGNNLPPSHAFNIYNRPDLIIIMREYRCQTILFLSIGAESGRISFSTSFIEQCPNAVLCPYDMSSVL